MESDGVTLRAVDPRGVDAIASMTAYFDELDERFPAGFDPGDTLVADAHLLEPPNGTFLVAYDAGAPVACGGVQTLGDGGMVLPLPNGKIQSTFTCIIGADDAMCEALAAAFPQGNMLDQDARYDVRASGVAVYDRTTGILSERIWQLEAQGRVVGANVALPPYVNRGRLTQLNQTDRPDVGPTRQVAAPGQKAHGLPPWVPLEER